MFDNSKEVLESRFLVLLIHCRRYVQESGRRDLALELSVLTSPLTRETQLLDNLDISAIFRYQPSC